MASKLKQAASALAGDDRVDEERRAQAELCLNSAVKCQRVLSICLSKECTDKEMRRIARKSCRQLLHEKMKASNCKQMCYARVLGKRTTSVVLEQGSRNVDDLVAGLNVGLKSKWDTCMEECQFQQGRDSSEYKLCVAKGYDEAVAKCAVDKCAAQSLKCLTERCY